MTIERRRHPRFPLLVQVTVHQKQEDFVMELLDLSQGGARLDLGGAKRPSWLALRRRLELHVPSREGAVTLRGQIVRIVEELDHREFGIQFESLLALDTLSAITGVAVDPAKPPPLPRRPARKPAPPPPPRRRL